MKKRYLLIILILLIFPMKFVNAAGLSVSITCDDIFKNESTTCTIKAKSSKKVSSIRGSVKLSSGISYAKSSNGSGWNGVIDATTFDLYTDTNKSGTFEVGTITLKGNNVGTYSITVYNVIASDEAFNEFDGGSSVKTFKVKSPTTTTKKTTTTTTKKTTTTTKKTTTSTTKKKTTTTTTTSKPPMVTHPQSTTQQTIPVDVKVELKIDSLRVDDFEVNYVDGAYHVVVNPETEEVNVLANVHSSLMVIGAGKRSLVVGNNTVELFVKNKMGESQKFILDIRRPTYEEVYNTQLKSLSIINYKLDFDPTKYEYTIKVPADVNEIYVLAEAGKDVTITGDGEIKLSKGNNIISIKTSMDDKISSTYKINIKRTHTTAILIGLFTTITFISTGAITYLILKQKDLKSQIPVPVEVEEEVDASILDTEPDVNHEVKPIEVQTVQEEDVEKLDFFDTGELQSVKTAKPAESISVGVGVQPQVVQKTVVKPQVKVVKKVTKAPSVADQLLNSNNDIQENTSVK